MSYISAKEAAQKWGISERMVYKYCTQNRIPEAYQDYGIWFIPEDAAKPSRIKKDTVNTPQIPPLLKNLIKQRDGRQYRGLYDYVQINMVYSNGRMASNRLTRNQIELLYKTDRIVTGSEAIKINDIIEARNHFLAVDMVLSNAMKPLNQTLIHQIQMQLVSDNCRHKRHAPIPYGYRKSSTAPKFGKTTQPSEIGAAMTALIKEYESQKYIGFHEILDFHVKFERIRPFEDCNGRVGRLLMFKECLRHCVTPFIVDDKRRTGYLEGIHCWDKDRSIFMDVCMEAQQGVFDSMVRSVLKELVSLYPHINYAVVLERMPPKRGEFDIRDYSDTMLPEGIETVPPRFAISWRNKWMIKQSGFVVTYITHSWGGAAQFTELAERQKKIVINLA